MKELIIGYRVLLMSRERLVMGQDGGKAWWQTRRQSTLPTSVTLAKYPLPWQTGLTLPPSMPHLVSSLAKTCKQMEKCENKPAL